MGNKQKQRRTRCKHKTTRSGVRRPWSLPYFTIWRAHAGAAGVHKTRIFWGVSFLLCLQIKVGDTCSKEGVICQGVPQRSHLSRSSSIFCVDNLKNHAEDSHVSKNPQIDANKWVWDTSLTSTQIQGVRPKSELLAHIKLTCYAQAASVCPKLGLTHTHARARARPVCTDTQAQIPLAFSLESSC